MNPRLLIIPVALAAIACGGCGHQARTTPSPRSEAFAGSLIPASQVKNIPFPSEEMSPTTIWSTGDRATSLAVWAGAEGAGAAHPGIGELAMIRENNATSGVTVKLFPVPGATTITITCGPAGVETSGQSGTLHWISENGEAGTFNLATDRVDVTERVRPASADHADASLIMA